MRPFAPRSASLSGFARRGPSWLPRRLLAAAWGVSLLFCTLGASAFPYIVEPGDTLARIAQKFYGRIQLERVLVTANRLDKSGIRSLTPGMILEIPAVTYHRITEGETWQSLAVRFLGHEARSIFLAEANGHKPWIQPELGQVIQLPYSLSWVASGEESIATLAYRFLGSTKQAWSLTQYNQLEKREVQRGEVLLLPLIDLPLTEEGRTASRAAQLRLQAEGQSPLLQTQNQATEQLRELAAEVRQGRYVFAVRLGAELLSAPALTARQKAQVQRFLLEAYVALELPGAARAACEEYLRLVPEATWDPIVTSPKILTVCASVSPPTEPPPPSE